MKRMMECENLISIKLMMLAPKSAAADTIGRNTYPCPPHRCVLKAPAGWGLPVLAYGRTGPLDQKAVTMQHPSILDHAQTQDQGN